MPSSSARSSPRRWQSRHSVTWLALSTRGARRRSLVGNGGQGVEEKGVNVWLEVVDPEVTTELGRYDEGPDRDGFALGALRLGVLAVRQARGELDALVVRQEGERIVGQIRNVLVEHGTKVSADI